MAKPATKTPTRKRIPYGTEPFFDKNVRDLNKLLAQRSNEKQILYEQYGKPFGGVYSGMYLAIAEDGQTILGTKIGELIQQAEEKFGSEQYGLFRVGHPTLETWRKSTR